MEKERLIFLLFLFVFLKSCASHHTRGRVVSRLSDTEGVMQVESDSVRPSDKLLIKRDRCHFGVRGTLICRNDEIGPATVETTPMNGEAKFRTPGLVDFQINDLLEPLN